MCCLFAPLPPWPAFPADKKLFAWREEEPSHILSPQLFHPPPHNDDNSHPFLSLPPSFSICAGVQPFLLLDTSLPFLFSSHASPTPTFSTQLMCNSDCEESSRKKWRMAGVGLRKSIRECREKAWGGSEGKQREGEVSLTSGFLSAVSATRSREGRGYFGLAHSGKRGGKRR